MSDPVSAAKSAREALSRALNAIQSDPSVPPQIMSIAEPISHAMGALFQVERTAGAEARTHGPVALEAVRKALGLLQQQPSQHPTVQRALEAVASSLSLVHGLANPPAAAPQAGPAPQAAPAPQAQPAPVAAAPQPARPQAPVQSPQAYAATYVAAPPVAAPQAPQAPPPQAPAPAKPAPQPQAHQPAPAPRGPAPAGTRIDAELGAHSSSNFYKGLSGNDVVEHGGLFVATYNIPRVGTQIMLHVSMPGGYEFDVAAVVKWTRETIDSSASGQGSQPGFGAQFTNITPEARQLVYRYVRNREPLFYDDL